MQPSNLIFGVRRTSWNLKFGVLCFITESLRYANFQLNPPRNNQMPPLSIFTPAAPSQPDSSAQKSEFSRALWCAPSHHQFWWVRKVSAPSKHGEGSGSTIMFMRNLPPNVVPPSNLICVARRTSWNLKFGGCPGIIESPRYANFYVITMRNKGMMSISNLVDSMQLH